MGNTLVTTLNSIRTAASGDYAARVPAATKTNISTVANAITSYSATLNEFTSVLVNKIAGQIFEAKLAQNKLAKFKKGFLPYGQDVEEVFVQMAQAEGAFDKTGANPLGRRTPTVKSLYHRENRQDKYVVSISKAQVHKAFQTENGILKLIDAQVNSLYSGANYDEYVLMKNLLATYSANYANYGVTAITDATTAAAFVRTVRKGVADLAFVSSAYNKAGVPTFTNPEDQVLLVNKDVIAHTDVDVLAKAFNLGKTDFEPNIEVLDDFGSMTGTYALLVDKDFFMVWDTLRETAEQYNADGLFTNYFFHIHQILSTSQFKNAIRFTTDTLS